MRVIVHDFGVGVNEYLAWGQDVPFRKPDLCPLCGRPSLKGHGIRSRVAWVGLWGFRLFVRRLICRGCPRRRPGTKSATFTILPNFLHQLKRYTLEEIDRVIQGRFSNDLSLRALAEYTPPVGPAPSTQQEWCQGFWGAAPLWLPVLFVWLVAREAIAVGRRVALDAAAGLLETAVQAQSVWTRPEDEPLLISLWTWGSIPRLPALLPPVHRRVQTRAPCLEQPAIEYLNCSQS
ncbi:MAG TPA: hypothetical protein VGO93_24410 [Candidatus Xenobia bacterium]